MAIDKWGTQVDALIDVKSTPSADATMITASCVAVRVIGDCDFCRHNFSKPRIACATTRSNWPFARIDALCDLTEVWTGEKAVSACADGG